MNRLGIESCVGLRLQSPDEIAADKRGVLPDTAMAALTPIHVHGDLHRRESVALLALEPPPRRPNAAAECLYQLGYLLRRERAVPGSHRRAEVILRWRHVRSARLVDQAHTAPPSFPMAHIMRLDAAAAADGSESQRSPIRRSVSSEAAPSLRTFESQLHRPGRADLNVAGNNENSPQLNDPLWLVSRSRS